MKVRVVWVGKTKNAGLAAASRDLAGRIGHLTAFEITELRQVRDPDDRKRTRLEGERILAALGEKEIVVVLDAGGREMSSEQFARFLGQHQREDPRGLAFVVGGPAGLSEPVRKRASHTWSLSRLTFSHDLARTVLLEQIYRGFSILHNLPYARSCVSPW